MTQPAFVAGQIYHVYNRGNNKENLFKEGRNYAYFLRLYRKYIVPIADTYAYSLLPNHFHFALELKDLDGLEDRPGFKPASRHLSNFFNAYTKTINKTYGRTGSLFAKNVRRKVITTETSLLRLITYIHINPQLHKIQTDFRDWPYSSFHALTSSYKTFLEREKVLSLFGGLDDFRSAHQDHLKIRAG